MTFAVDVRRAPPPSLRPGGHGAECWSAYAALRLEAAVNLAEDRRYRDQPAISRLELAVADQRAFLNVLLDPRADVVYDLRLIAGTNADGLDAGLVIRAWAEDEHTARARVLQYAHGALRSAPDHVVLSEADEAALARLLHPFADNARAIGAAFITRREVTMRPVRPDVREEISYHFSVLPWSFAPTDWSRLYDRLGGADDPVVLSVALRPQRTDLQLAHWLETYATRYQQWASPDRLQGALYSGERALPPEAFAVDAAPTYRDYAQRLRSQSFVMRVMVASPGGVAPGLAEAVGGTVSALDTREASHYDAMRGAAVFERRGDERVPGIGGWNLDMVDVCTPPGEPQIWEAEAPPPAPLAALAVVGDARDAACAFRLPIAHTGDLPGIRVRRGRFGQAEAAAGGRRPILLGALPGGEGELRIDANSLSKHALIAGGTGSGKTTLVLELLRQLWAEYRIPFLVIEPVNSDANDYRKLGSLPGFSELEVYTVGDERFRPLRFNPFAVPDGVLVGEHMAALLECFKAAFGLWDPLPAIYEEAIADTYLSRGVLPGETGGQAEQREWPTVIHFRDAMDRATSGLGYAGEVKANLDAASVIRAKQLVFGAGATTFRTFRPLDVETLMRRPVILELKTLGSGDEQALMMALILNAITTHYKATRGAQSEIQHVTVVEEAHRLLGRAKGAVSSSVQAQAKEQAAEAFANVLAENRKYGEGVIIAEQIPSKLVEDALKNTNLKVMARLTSEEERVYLGEAMAMTPEQLRQAARLVVGQALVYSDELASPTEVAVHRTIGSAELATPTVLRVPPMRGCDVCPARCEFRSTGLALSRRPRLSGAVANVVKFLREPKPAEEEAQAEREKAKQAIPSQLARAAIAEAKAFPSLATPGDVRAAATCAVIHSLDGRVPVGWSSRVADRIARLTTAEKASA